jgi:hypothetical protein
VNVSLVLRAGFDVFAIRLKVFIIVLRRTIITRRWDVSTLSTEIQIHLLLRLRVELRLRARLAGLCESSHVAINELRLSVKLKARNLHGNGRWHHLSILHIIHMIVLERYHALLRVSVSAYTDRHHKHDWNLGHHRNHLNGLRLVCYVIGRAWLLGRVQRLVHKLGLMLSALAGSHFIR